MFDRSLARYWEPSDTAESRTLIDEIGACGRAEARAAAARLVAIGKLFAMLSPSVPADVQELHNGEEAPFAGHALELVSSAVLEFES